MKQTEEKVSRGFEDGGGTSRREAGGAGRASASPSAAAWRAGWCGSGGRASPRAARMGMAVGLDAVPLCGACWPDVRLRRMHGQRIAAVGPSLSTRATAGTRPRPQRAVSATGGLLEPPAVGIRLARTLALHGRGMALLVLW